MNRRSKNSRSKTKGRKNNKSKTKTNRTNRRRTQKGGVYGRGYGANCYDPNYNIYNTNMLKLFPYTDRLSK